MYFQCLQCTKKYRFNPAAVPVEGAFATCKGCGGKIRVEPRNNVEGDHTRIPVTKAKHQKEVKWYARTEETLREMGFEKKTSEYNMMFYFMREFRKRFGITFFDITCNARVKTVDRELMYNRLSFFGNCCVPPRDKGDFESCIGGLLGGMSEVLSAKDSAGRFSVGSVMRTAYPDSFPALVRFAYGASFETSFGETAFGNAVQVDISMDQVRQLPVDYDGMELEKYARVEISRVPIETGRLTFRELTVPGLVVHADPDPDLRCADPAVTRIVERYL